jgi:hypothetical protein
MRNTACNVGTVNSLLVEYLANYSPELAEGTGFMLHMQISGLQFDRFISNSADMQHKSEKRKNPKMI